MPCNEETPLLYEAEQNLKTTFIQMVLSFIALILCVMLIVLPIIIASMILLGSSHHEDVELSSSILISKLRHRITQPNSLIDSAENDLQYEFVVPIPSFKATKFDVASTTDLGDKLKDSIGFKKRYSANYGKFLYGILKNLI